MLRSTLAFFAEHLGASAAERYPRPAIDDRRMASLEKMVTPSGQCSGLTPAAALSVVQFTVLHHPSSPSDRFPDILRQVERLLCIWLLTLPTVTDTLVPSLCMKANEASVLVLCAEVCTAFLTETEMLERVSALRTNVSIA